MITVGDILLMLLICILVTAVSTSVFVCYVTEKPRKRTTYIEKLFQEHPEQFEKLDFNKCPWQFGYEHERKDCLPTSEKCRECWNREVRSDKDV
jgi:hypothetical protein